MSRAIYLRCEVAPEVFHPDSVVDLEVTVLRRCSQAQAGEGRGDAPLRANARARVRERHCAVVCFGRATTLCRKGNQLCVCVCAE